MALGRLFVSSSLVSICVLYLSLFASIDTVRADALPYNPPPCSDMDNAVYDLPACGFYYETFTVDNLDVLNNIVYVYRRDSYYSRFDDSVYSDFSLATSTSLELQTNPYRQSSNYFAFAKDKLQGGMDSLDLLSIFRTATTTDKVNSDLFSSPELQKGTMYFVVSKDDESLGLPALVEGSPYLYSSTTIPIGAEFIKLDSLSVNPYVQTPVTDPRKQAHFFYSPLGIYGGNKIVLYRSKEVQTLDDGSQKTLAFPPPSIDGVVPFGTVSHTRALAPAVTMPVAVPVPAPQSWWESLWCLIKGVFGKSC